MNAERSEPANLLLVNGKPWIVDCGDGLAGAGFKPAQVDTAFIGPTNQKLIDRVHQDVAAQQAENPGQAVLIDLVTTSASGFDPHITPAVAEYQLPRVAKERGTTVDQLRAC